MGLTKAEIKKKRRKAIAEENPFIPRCRNCGRRLFSKDSIKNGFGLACGAQFGIMYIKEHPLHLGDRAKKIWTKEEIDKLMLMKAAV